MKKLKVRKAIISFKQQTEIWLPENRDQGCSIIGKFTQGRRVDCKRLTRRLLTDPGELDFLVKETRKSGTLLSAPQRCPLGHILTYYEGWQPQYTHLRASILAYAHINLLLMLARGEPEEVVRVTTDSLYIQKKALWRLEGVEAYVPSVCWEKEIEELLRELAGKDIQFSHVFRRREIGPAQWRDKDEKLFLTDERAVYFPKPEHIRQAKQTADSTMPSYHDPLSRRRLSYLNGGGGSGKTARAINLFKDKNLLLLTPTHRLAKEMRGRGGKAQTHHSFFRWSGKNDWTPERMGKKFIPRVII